MTNADPDHTILEALKRAIRSQFGELTRQDLAMLARRDAHHQVLVKLGSGRFVASAQDAPGIIACIDQHEHNYVRGIWLLADDPWMRPCVDLFLAQANHGTYTPADGVSHDD